MLVGVALYTGAVIALLVVLTIVSPLTYVRVPVGFDRHGQVTESRGECSVSPSAYSAAAGLFAGVVVLVAGALLVLHTLAARSKSFSEEF